MEKKTEYQISSSVNKEIPEITITGSAKGDNFLKMLNDVDTILKSDRPKKAIFDIRYLNKSIGFIEVYHFIRSEPLPSFIFEVESAIVDVPENTPLRTIVKNVGLPWEWFTDMNVAREWMRGH